MLHGATAACDTRVAVRVFETYPPSCFIVALALGAALVIGGLEFAVPLAVGCALVIVGGWLDHYGTDK